MLIPASAFNSHCLKPPQFGDESGLWRLEGRWGSPGPKAAIPPMGLLVSGYAGCIGHAVPIPPNIAVLLCTPVLRHTKVIPVASRYRGQGWLAVAAADEQLGLTRFRESRLDLQGRVIVASIKSLLTSWAGGIVLLATFAPLAAAQSAPPHSGFTFERGPLQMHVSKPLERVELMVNTSRILTMEQNIPRLFVSNPEVLKAMPLSPNQVQVSGLQTGTAQVNLWDEEGEIYTLDVVVLRDVSELLDVLRSEFPEANLRIRPLAESIYITGYVPRPELVGEILRVAEDYHQKIINGITVGGVHQVALHVKVMEVSRTKLRDLGIDWQYFGRDFSVSQGAGNILSGAADIPGMSDTVRFSVVSNSTEFMGYLSALRENNLVKLLSEPTLITMTGRAASFTSGGRFPILVPSGLGTTGVQFEEYGTRVDFVPVVLGNGHIRLEVRPTISELDESRGVELNGIRIPGLTERSVDTSVEMRAGQTLALAGLIQNRVESRNRGLPFLGDLPFVGRAFSRVQEKMNEVELLVTVMPEIVAPLDPHQVPLYGPGQMSTTPNDHEFYWQGHLEVPHTGMPCPAGQPPYSAYPVSEGWHPAPEPVPVQEPSSANDPVSRSSQPQSSVERASWRPGSQGSQPMLIGPSGYDPLR